MKGNIAIIPLRGIAYHTEDGVELGSIVIRPEHIAFIAGSWCKQISRRYGNRQELLDISREHERRLKRLLKEAGVER